jgi:2-phosphosulfolactate phosphatase
VDRTRRRTVTIDCFASSVPRHAGRAIVAIDVIRCTTTAVTAAAMGRRCFVAASIEEAMEIAGTLNDPLLTGELGGSRPFGFDLQNSPAGMASRGDIHRPAVLLTTSGTDLLRAAADTAETTYASCLRNYSAQAAHVSELHEDVAIIGAGTRGEFRQEDQLCCAWVARELLAHGYEATDTFTHEVIERWESAEAAAAAGGPSAEYLRDTGQVADLEFILGHVDDLDQVFEMVGRELVGCRAPAPQPPLAAE